VLVTANARVACYRTEHPESATPLSPWIR